MKVVGFVHEELMTRDHSDLRNNKGLGERNYRTLTEKKKSVFLEQRFDKVRNKNRKIGWSQIVKELECYIKVLRFFLKVRVLVRGMTDVIQEKSSNSSGLEGKKINGRKVSYQAIKVVLMKSTEKKEVKIEIRGHILKIFQSTEFDS